MKIRTTSFGIARDEGTPSSDAFATRAWDQTVIAVVSDGAGSGTPAREAALRAVASLIVNYSAKPRNWEPQRALVEFTSVLNRALFQESQARYERSEMVATLAVTVIEGDRLFGANLGDSRVYLCRDGVLQQLSVDHIDTERTNMLTRALGMVEEVEPQCFVADLRDGDLVFLCSDGVWNQLTNDELALALKRRTTPQNIVMLARDKASAETLDDMSAVLLDVQKTGKLRAMKSRELALPSTLQKGEVFDGYELLRPFRGTDRVWLAEKEGQRVVL